MLIRLNEGIGNTSGDLGQVSEESGVLFFAEDDAVP
jgi:hypothetical protein